MESDNQRQQPQQQGFSDGKSITEDGSAEGTAVSWKTGSLSHLHGAAETTMATMAVNSFMAVHCCSNLLGAGGGVVFACKPVSSGGNSVALRYIEMIAAAVSGGASPGSNQTGRYMQHQQLVVEYAATINRR